MKESASVPIKNAIEVTSQHSILANKLADRLVLIFRTKCSEPEWNYSVPNCRKCCTELKFSFFKKLAHARKKNIEQHRLAYNNTIDHTISNYPRQLLILRYANKGSRSTTLNKDGNKHHQHNHMWRAENIRNDHEAISASLISNSSYPSHTNRGKDYRHLSATYI
ncbi:hypothetical protein HELRODRAFT_162202 [Helobdella robusta]|uniref:Uncharacterized protein n=1 Tax=Helobdella robusta TaxID=6412 RepID=T1ESC7_HELRO|nr:hypothetical protein HELRODRAFT_162202 [Helobdella robusta]ESN98750.1 hypothetical protein HELRODRAFT_162202 [Helobdella robusta]